VARTAGPEPRITLPDEDGTVRAALRLTATPANAWSALTEPARLDQWLGSLDGKLVPGASLRLDFGDGDFFDIEVEDVTEPTLAWSWRFMGCAPRDMIEFRVLERAGGSEVVVTDREPHRTREEALGLGEGWRDFLRRLALNLLTGERTRYDWRSEVDVWTELDLSARDARRLLIGAPGDWLPLSSGAMSLLTAPAVVLDDGEQPRSYAIEEVAGDGPAAVRFQLQPEGIGGRLATRIEIGSRGERSTLSISQTGFRALNTGDLTRRRTRERFATAWLSAARCARSLASRAATGAEVRTA
jgi:uncharacterized protein YndB with AHSA1/START domain